MKHIRVLLFALFLLYLSSSLVLTTSSATYSESALSVNSPQDIEAPDMTPEKTFAPADVDNYIFMVDSWLYGYIDGYYSGQSGFSLSNLQHEDDSHATLSEAAVSLTAQFSYTFRISPTDWSSYDDHYLQVYGRCTTAPEDLEVYYTMPGGSEVLAYAIDSTSDQLHSISLPDTYTAGVVLVRVVDTTADAFESVSAWSLDHIRLRCSDYKTVCESVRVDTAFDTDNLYPMKGSGTNDYYVFTTRGSDGDGGNNINQVYLSCKTESGTYLWIAAWHSGVGFGWSTDSTYGNHGELYEAGCSASYSGTVRTVVYAVRLFYDHPEVDNVDFELWCSSPSSDDIVLYDQPYVGGGSTQRDLDVHTALTWDVTPALAKTICDPGSSVSFNGTAKFAASGSGVLAGHYGVEVTRTTPASPTWNTTQWTDTGTFTVSCPTVGVAGDENTFQAVLISNLGTNLLDPSSDTVTLDSVVGYDYGVVDDLIDVGSSTTIFTKLRYVSDGTEITGGTLTWSGISMSYDFADGRWEGTTTTETSPTTITYSSISVETPEGITTIHTHSNVSVVWVLKQADLHLNPLETSILVSTIYDPRNFSIDVYLTDTGLNLISGWINITIDGNEYVVYCDGLTNSVFYFTPMVSGIYTLEAVFEGDSAYNATETSIMLTANPRDIVFIFDIPTEITALTSTPVGFLDVYDNDFVGEYQGITYVRNFPVNASYSIWWTISPDYGYPRIFTGTWSITMAEGSGLVTIPWDLDRNGVINNFDFICYFIIDLDGLGVYENITIETPVDILQSLAVNLQMSPLTFSDQSAISVQIHPLYDPSFVEGLDLTVTLYVSDDNSTWVVIGEFATNTSGWQSMNWTCANTNALFFKAETSITNLYARSSGYAYSEVGKETTILTIEHVGNFTYSDQGILVACFSTDDGEPLSGYTIFLEMLDGTWISMGSGLTNDSGHVSILWTPTLPAGVYTVQIRMSLEDSQIYLTPDNAMGLLEVGKESTVVSIDSTTISQGYIRARVTDDDGTPIPSTQVHFYTGSNREYQGSVTTDTDGYSRLNITLNDGELLEAVVNEDEFYYGSSQQITVTISPDFLLLGVAGGSVFLLAAGIAVSRKITRGRSASAPPSVSPEVSEALVEERDSIPERVRERSERRIAELDEMSRDGGGLEGTTSSDGTEGVTSTDDKIE